MAQTIIVGVDQHRAGEGRRSHGRPARSGARRRTSGRYRLRQVRVRGIGLDRGRHLHQHAGPRPRGRGRGCRGAQEHLPGGDRDLGRCHGQARRSPHHGRGSARCGRDRDRQQGGPRHRPRLWQYRSATSPRTRRATSMSSTRSRATETTQDGLSASCPAIRNRPPPLVIGAVLPRRSRGRPYRWSRPRDRKRSGNHCTATPCRDGKVASAIRGSSAGRSPGARASLHRPDRGRCPRSPSRCQCAAARSSVQPRGSRRGTGPDVLRRAQPQ